MVIAGMLLAARDIIGGINWVQEHEEDGNLAKAAEKAEKGICRNRVARKRTGGDRSWCDRCPCCECGCTSRNGSVSLGYRLVDAHGDSPETFIMQRRWIKFAEIVIILPYMFQALPDTTGMINRDSLSLMKKGVVVLNFARDVLVDSEAMSDVRGIRLCEEICYRFSDSGNCPD